MRAIDALRRSGVGIGPEKTVREAAEIMNESGVGSLAVVERGRLIGIVTDRDLVRRVIARGKSLDGRVDDAMSAPVVSISFDADVHAAIGLLGTHCVRRLAVVRGEEFVGMISLDDLLVELASDLSDLVVPVDSEIRAPHREGQVPVAV